MDCGGQWVGCEGAFGGIGISDQAHVVPAEAIQPFDGRDRIVSALGAVRKIVNQTCPINLVVRSPWGEVRIFIPSVLLSGPEYLVPGRSRESNDA